MFEPARDSLRRSAPWLSLLGLWLMLALLRVAVGSQSALTQSDCFSCFALASLKHDLPLFALLALFTIAGNTWRWLAPLPIMLQFAALVIVVADLALLLESGQRLNSDLAIRLIDQPPLIIEALNNYLAEPKFWLGAVFVVVGLALLWSHWRGLLQQSRDANSPLLAVLAFVAASLYLLPGTFSHALPWSYRNLIHSNLRTGVDRPYSAGFVKASANGAAELPKPNCRIGDSSRQDVIVLLLSSWSWYHGNNLRGGLNATPTLDGLMDQYTWWSAFHANGFSRDQNLIALLTEADPIPAVNRYRSRAGFSGFNNHQRNLAERLHAYGYRTSAFLLPNDRIDGQNQWLAQVGFDTIDESDVDGPQPASAGFDDSALYARFLSWLGNQHPVGEPFFALLQTPTTQPPFFDPISAGQDEAAAFRFADIALAEFYATLTRIGYFERGILIVTSDQRALTPLRHGETEVFGDAAAARLPLVVVGEGFAGRGRIDTPAQMKDLGASLDRLLGSEGCAQPDAGDLFANPPRPPRCIIHAQGNRRDLIQTFCGDDYAAILLDGDRTRLLHGEIPESAGLIDQINQQRTTIGALDDDLERIW